MTEFRQENKKEDPVEILQSNGSFCYIVWFENWDNGKRCEYNPNFQDGVPVLCEGIYAGN